MHGLLCLRRWPGLLARRTWLELDAQKEHHSSSDLRRAIHSRDDHDYCASGDRRKAREQCRGAAWRSTSVESYIYLAQDVRRRLEISQMSQQAQVSHRILKLDSKCLGSLHFNYIGSMMASWAVSPTQSTSWSHIIHFSRQICELSPCVGAPHINLQSKTWNISKSKQHYYLLS